MVTGYLSFSRSQALPGNTYLEALPRWNKGGLLIRGRASAYALPGKAWEREEKEKTKVLTTNLSNLVVVESLLKRLFSELEDAQTKATNRLV